MNKRLLATALLLGGCALVQPVSRGATLILKPRITAPRSTQTELPAYTKALINHVILQVFTLNGGVEQSKVAERSIPQQDLDNTVIFSNLKDHTAYRIKAMAYATADESTLISNLDAGACFDITITTNDQPTISGITLTLIDRLFSAELPTGAQITNGGLIPAGGEQLVNCTDPVIRVTTLAGSINGYVDGIGTAARFAYPQDVAYDENGNLYVADNNNNMIRKITPAGVVSTLAGNRIAGTTDGTGTAAQFYYPQTLAYHNGLLYVSDLYGYRIRTVTMDGVVKSFVGQTGCGFADGSGASALFHGICGITVDASGTLFVTDNDNYRIRSITPDGVVTTVAGGTSSGFQDGDGSNALFYDPWGITVDSSGNLYVSDVGRPSIRKITPTGTVTTIAGNGTSGNIDANGNNAKFYSPKQLAIDSTGNIYIADANNYRIRVLKPNGDVITLAGSGLSQTTNSYGINAGMYYPCGIAIDKDGNLAVAQSSDYLIRRLEWINGKGL